MNACGQHSIASFGLHGSSMRREGATMPAMQILVGGGRRANGEWSFGKKILKLPTKHVPAALRTVLIDFEQHQLPHETFADYFLRVGDRYHYNLLQQHVEGTAEDLYVDWGSETAFKPQIGVGECAGVVIDLVSTLLLEAREKLDLGIEAMQEGRWGHAIYHAYAAQIAGAKALLVKEGEKTNTNADILAQPRCYPTSEAPTPKCLPRPTSKPRRPSSTNSTVTHQPQKHHEHSHDSPQAPPVAGWRRTRRSRPADAERGQGFGAGPTRALRQPGPPRHPRPRASQCDIDLCRQACRSNQHASSTIGLSVAHNKAFGSYGSKAAIP